MFCYPEMLRGDISFFEGTNQYARYSVFRAVIKKYILKKEVEQANKGIEVEEEEGELSKKIGEHQ